MSPKRGQPVEVDIKENVRSLAVQLTSMPGVLPDRDVTNPPIESRIFCSYPSNKPSTVLTHIDILYTLNGKRGMPSKAEAAANEDGLHMGESGLSVLYVLLWTMDYVECFPSKEPGELEGKTARGSKGSEKILIKELKIGNKLVVKMINTCEVYDCEKFMENGSVQTSRLITETISDHE
ncbi:hypothetical protein KQX54_004636 [Cotesia glomerata]|uniref:Uncharacterized protein n=1 Tax=Cotesia glomerata TaxID=32391 RepID=A0AAV7HHQ1_COTGL|nr:hypothetical protein KQX54_004636 [Cotesia glomerata]